MSDPTDSEHPDPADEAVDDIFTAAARRPTGRGREAPSPAGGPAEPVEADPDRRGADLPLTSADSPYPDEPPADPIDTPLTSADSPYPDEPPADPIDTPLTSADSPYPDGHGGTLPDDAPYPDGVGGGFGRGSHGEAGGPPPPPVPPMQYPPAVPDRRPYPAGPAYPVQREAFGRRPPITGPRPDADGYYPGDYYLAPDWMGIIVKGLVSVVIILALVAGGTWLWDEYAPTTSDDDAVEEPTPTPVPLVSVFLCAGDPQAVSQMLAPSPVLIAGRTADSRWLAFRNPDAPPEQLWIRAVAVPDFEPTTVGVVPCASAPNEFPTPARRPTPVPTIAATPSD